MDRANHNVPVAARGFLPVLLVLAVCTGCDPGGEPAPLVNSTVPSGTASRPEPTAGTATAAAPSATRAPVPGQLLVTDEITAGLGLPWSVAELPDGSILATERDTAEVKRIVGGRVDVIGVIEDAVGAGGEGGLLGLAIGPDFRTEPRIYLYYTSATDNRIVSLPYNGNELGEPEEILTGIPRAGVHNGGRIKFGPDGHLYVGTGDASNASNAQDPSSLGGKILRLTAAGAPAPGNPSGGAVYSLGHRNVQGLAWDSAGRLWASEFGPDRDDELNLIVPGGNYGWPEVTGAPGHPDYIDASVVWPSTATSSPSGIAITDDVAYIGGLRGERLWQVPLRSGTPGEPTSFLDGSLGRLRDVIAAADGSLLVATNESNGSRIVRVEMQ